MHDAWFANDESTHTSKTVMLAYTIRKFHPCTSLVLLLVSILIFLDIYSAHLALTCGRMSNLKNLHNSMAYCEYHTVEKSGQICRRKPCMRPSQCIVRYSIWQYNAIVLFSWNKMKTERPFPLYKTPCNWTAVVSSSTLIGTQQVLSQLPSSSLVGLNQVFSWRYSSTCASVEAFVSPFG